MGLAESLYREKLLRIGGIQVIEGYEQAGHRMLFIKGFNFFECSQHRVTLQFSSAFQGIIIKKTHRVDIVSAVEVPT